MAARLAIAGALLGHDGFFRIGVGAVVSRARTALFVMWEFDVRV